MIHKYNLKQENDKQQAISNIQVKKLLAYIIYYYTFL